MRTYLGNINTGQDVQRHVRKLQAPKGVDQRLQASQAEGEAWLSAVSLSWCTLMVSGGSLQAWA